MSLRFYQRAKFIGHSELRTSARGLFAASVRACFSLVPCLMIATCVCLSGCDRGSSTEESEAPAPVPDAQGSAPVPIPQGSPDPVVQKTRKKPAQPKITNEDINDVFEFSSKENFAIMTEEEQGQWQESGLALATIPSAGINSSQFVTIQADDELTISPQVIVELPDNFTAISDAGYTPEGYPKKILCEIDQSVMVLIPSGSFLQGNDGENKNAEPEHSIYLDGYYIDEHEVTVESYLKFREYESSLEKRPPQLPSNAQSNPNNPAMGMLWRDAKGYANYVGKKLPSEAEWEKAARGTEGFDHPWGFGRAAWRRPRVANQIYPVMSYPADKSPYGVFDMAGNAKEWCSDWYQAEAYQRLLDDSNEAPRNWLGPRNSDPKSHRVIKGSSPAGMIWHRDHRSLSDRDPQVGFRCVLRQEKPTTPEE
ncbi:MAG: SUMF1/EgtB/PvdO family nonheme iron enzyme [Planctomycetaceae bacterium]|nr:SUMF1/EgtB/PvdO family nonheme iron enzyme [Planctomycetaceae bacterium]